MRDSDILSGFLVMRTWCEYLLLVLNLLIVMDVFDSLQF